MMDWLMGTKAIYAGFSLKGRLFRKRVRWNDAHVYAERFWWGQVYLTISPYELGDQTAIEDEIWVWMSIDQVRELHDILGKLLEEGS